MAGPFAPEQAILGGIPTPDLDVPITGVFLVLFMSGAATHFILHELNRKRGHKFHLSDLVFDFCMVRVVTCTMRIVWAFLPNNVNIVLAALIFENAGVIVLLAVNIVLTQRILRAIHPNFGWHPIVSKIVFVLLASVPVTIFWNISVLTASFFTKDPKTAAICHDFILFGASYATFLSTIPIWVVGLAGSIPSPTKIEKFGVGRFRYKIILLLSSTTILLAGTLIRLIGGIHGYPAYSPGPINSKPLFYTTGFTLEIIVVIAYAVFRFDLLFHIPDGCASAGDYRKGKQHEEEFDRDDDITMGISVKTVDYETAGYLPTRDQIYESVMQMRLQAFIVGHPIESGDSELILYAFRAKRDETVRGRPTQASSWYDSEVTMVNKQSGELLGIIAATRNIRVRR